MSSDVLNSKKLLLGKILAVAASSCFFGCTMDPYIITAEEQYTRNFIKDFGLVDEKQDWNLAKAATVSINLGSSVRKSVKIYCNYGGNFYLVADLTDISGKIEVPVDLPKVCNDIMVVTGDRKYYGNLGSTIDCSDMSRGVPQASDIVPGSNPNPDVYTNTVSDYTVKVKHTTRGNGEDTGYSTTDGGAYQYFNTQQMSPIISTTPWHEYYSINTQKKTANPGNWVGLLPESGKFNRLASDLNSWITKKKDEKQSIVEDFRINTSNDGSFTIFPYYYGTNLKHELGVYLLNDDGTPILKSGGTYDSSADYSLDDFVSFPIFQDRAPGDLQVQAHYDGDIEDIRINNMNGVTLTNTEPETKKNTPLTFTLGENYNLEDYVEIKKNNNWIPYKTYIKDDGRKFHSRVAYHFWVDEPDESLKHNPDSFARIDNNGYVTPLKITRNHENGTAYANVAIATDLINSKLGAGVGKIKGVELNFTYKVVPPGPIYSIDIAEDDLNMCVGQTKTLDVTLKDKDGNTLLLADYIDKISVTEWDTDKYTIYKDGNTIKITAKAPGEFWPRVYENKYGYDNIFDYVHLTIGNHWFSDSHTGPDAAMSENTWHGYFDQYVEQDIFDKIDNATITKWGGAKVDPAAFSTVPKDYSTDYSIVFELGSPDALYLAYNWSWTDNNNNEVHNNEFENEYTYKVDGIEHTSSDFITEKGTSFELPVQNWMIERLQSTGLLIQAKEVGNTTITKMALRRPIAEGEVIDADPVWKSGGKAAAQQDLTIYYQTHKPGDPHDCENCGKKDVDFSNATPTVSLTRDASYNNISYTVTWTVPGPTPTQSKHRAPARSRSVSSRELWEDEDREKMLTDNGNWKDVNSFWSRYLPKQEEVASYPPNVCMLARSRGYDVTITYGIDKDGNPKPWQGSLGMYLKVLGSYDIKTTSYDANGDGNYKEEYTPYVKNNSDKTKEEYVVFSQKKFNKGADGRSSDQISALSVKHPASGRTFLTFEDMRLTRKDVTPADFYKEKSSDRDVNDLIFNITNYGDITNGKETITEKPVDEGFSWLWAVEDLGSTDDFDFNDMVMKITTATRSLKTEETKEENGKTTTVTTNTTLYKKVTFTPLCAGGTLPLYVHYSPSAGTHYTLRPGAYQEPSLGYEINDAYNKGTIYPIDRLTGGGDDAAEIHRWFGVSSSTEMINTGMGGGLRTVTEGCTLYLPISFNFTISGFGEEGGSIKGGKTNGGLYVTVNDGNPVESIDEIETGVWTTEDGGKHWAIKAPTQGSASQMFIIFDANTPWRWPRERTHILNPYPKFTDWVNDMESSERWYDLGPNTEGYTFPRYDINK